VNLSGLLPAIQKTPPYVHTLKKLWTPEGGASAFTLSWSLLEGARPAVLAALQQDWLGPILVLAAQPERARFLQEQTSLWAAQPRMERGTEYQPSSWYFPAPDALFYDRTPWDGETIHQRVSVLSALSHRDYTRPPMLFTSVWALMTLTVPPEVLRPGIVVLTAGQTMRLTALVNDLVAFAYEPVSVVEEPGTFSQRGGILDIYPPNGSQPLRVEWLEDQVESIRTFDPLTQRSVEKLEQVTLYPASEALARYSHAAAQCLSHLEAGHNSPANPATPLPPPKARGAVARARSAVAESTGRGSSPAENALHGSSPAENAGRSSSPAENAGRSSSPAENAGRSSSPAKNAGRSSGLSLSRWQRDRERLDQQAYFRGMEFYLPCLYPQPVTLLDYLPSHVLLLVDDLATVEEAARTLESQSADLRAELLEESQIPSDFPAPYRPWGELVPSLASLPGIHLGHFASSTMDAEATDRFAPPSAMDEDLPADAGRSTKVPPRIERGTEFRTYHAGVSHGRASSGFHLPPAYAGRIEPLIEDSQRFRAEKQRVVIVSKQAQRLSDLFAQKGEHAVPVESVTDMPAPGSLTLVQGSLAEGWALGDGHSVLPAITLLSDAEIFGWARPKRRSFTRKKAASPESFFAELHVGDHVVHIDHGIGIYRGLVRKEVDQSRRTGPAQTAERSTGGGMEHRPEREYLEVEYAEGDRVYVPVSQMDRVTRYVGSDHVPALHRLGAADWALVRSRAKKAVEDIARELLSLYAARTVVPGHAFSPDVAWQEELEASFPYEETEDQLHALAEVKADMEQPRPMDRLICGDVGYGKTEVAVRAAFKAVMDGKQVAVLVPTTVLAQQHLLTFQQRLAAFPVRVTMLSRFCSPQEERDALEGLREGCVDIVVGTHRLLQNDVLFKNLGLLIVDEEQRFGVRHKEWLKQMRQQVDVLTLTATPIPRTLYMALSEVRDMSTIDTPPEERLPIRTQVAEYDEGLIRRAVLREMNRGGQVYFVHNRVQGIRQVAQRLQRVVPEATLAIGHGQMPEEKLSRVMLDFAQGKYDVLVCTSIIESGLDIPNVNTIIMNRADQFGLAQLYQLRGRVGRSSAQAYAYLLGEKRLRLSEVARRRLEAILEASELGSGFRIAMRDLEIRGAGEILGAQQHGHIAAIGFELYTRLLAQAVDELKAKGPKAGAALPDIELPPVIELPLQAFLPEDYVPEENLRVKMYQRMTSLKSEDELDNLRQEMEDRFGLLPPATEDLLYVLRVRLLASRAGVQTVGREDSSLVLKLNARAQERASRIAARFGRRAWVGRGQMWLALGEEDADWREMLVALLLQLGAPDEQFKAGQAQ
jgi:transcription-repair coupling factor (superfamily II helicase)